MKRFLLAGCGLLALAATASAADLPRGTYNAPAAYAPVYNWSGLYIGAHAGYGWSGSSDINMRGGFIGGQIGFYQPPAFSRKGMALPGIDNQPLQSRDQRLLVIDRHQQLMWKVGDLMHHWEQLQAEDVPANG